MTQDGRIGAWVHAWQLAQAAGNIRDQLTVNGRPPDEFPDVYWGVLAEAAVYAQLIGASDITGFSVGEWLERQQQALDDAAEKGRHSGMEFIARTEE